MCLVLDDGEDVIINIDVDLAVSITVARGEWVGDHKLFEGVWGKLDLLTYQPLDDVAAGFRSGAEIGRALCPTHLLY